MAWTSDSCARRFCGWHIAGNEAWNETERRAYGVRKAVRRDRSGLVTKTKRTRQEPKESYNGKSGRREDGKAIMMDLTIKEIAHACSGELVVQSGKADGDTCVSSVVIDSRQVEPQGVFIATVGERVDGHRFIRTAFGKGAILAVTQKRPEEVEGAERRAAGAPDDSVPQNIGASGDSAPGAAAQTDDRGAGESWGCYVLVEDTLQALKDIAEAYRKKLSIKVVGITGSVGKTSTKEFIAGVLAEKYHILKTEGNFNNEIGVPLTLLRIRREHEIAVVEMGISDFGEMHRLSKMARPDVCVMTNIGQSHLNNLKDRDGILRAKSEIFDYMAPDGEICLNGEDDRLNALTEIKGHKPRFFGLGSSPSQEVAAVDIVGRGLWGSDATLVMSQLRSPWNAACADKGAVTNGTYADREVVESGACACETAGMDGVQAETMTGMGCAGREAAGTESGACRLAVHIPQPGRHMVLNAAAAACVARLLGLSGEQIATGIGKVAAVSGRTHIISHPHYTIIDDCYNANPASVKAALDLLALADTRKVAILGDMLNLGENSGQLHEEIGSYAVAAGIDDIYCVGEESRCMYRAANQTAEQAGTNQMTNQAATDRTDQTMGRTAAKRTEETARLPRRIAHYPDRKVLMETMAADKTLIPEGSTVLIKASHDMGFAEILEFLQSMD